MAVSERMLSNEQLVALFQQGEERVFVVLAERMMPMLRIEASHMAAREADNDDLVQEAMLALLKAAQTYDASRKASFATFCRLCVKNRLINAAQRIQTPEWPQDNHKILQQVDRQESADLGLQDRLEETESDMALLKRLQKELSKLEYRVLICHLAAYTYEEIAALLNISVKSVDNAMQRVRRKLSPWLT